MFWGVLRPYNEKRDNTEGISRAGLIKTKTVVVQNMYSYEIQNICRFCNLNGNSYESHKKSCTKKPTFVELPSIYTFFKKKVLFFLFVLLYAGKNFLFPYLFILIHRHF